MHRTLIVARLEPEHQPAVANLFAESDSGQLPHLVGVSRRTLFGFHGLYFHLVEADEDVTPRLYRARSDPRYQELSAALARYMRPYDPNWAEPKDAMAAPFYSWSADAGHRTDLAVGAGTAVSGGQREKED